MQQFEEWLIGITGESYLLIAEIFLIVLAALVMGYLAGRLLDFLQKHAEMTANFWDDALVEACRRPVVWAIWTLGVNSAAALAAREANSEWYELLAPVNRVIIIFLAALFLLNLIKRVERNLVHPDYTSDPVDETTVKAIGKLLRASVIITATLIAMQAFGYSISGLLAFGGIGGLAMGFAAKDLLANFFGGLMIYLDQPFKVGDWVRSPDKEIEGTVEDIGWRLTRIRTFDKRPLYVPNSVFNSIALENPSRMFNRRIYETVGIRYQDIDKMAGIVADVKQMLCDHLEIDQTQTLIVNFVSFGASSINFFVYTFTRTTKWVAFHEVKQDVLFKVSDIVARHGAEIAFPTSTVHIPDQLRLLQAAEVE
ncbi:mechanosensitive ion channel family protein [Porticoccus sp.]|uniref:mechanosensitive ion channel family protein n=1 Tax=Porticoccus sp. TaxID=2024853 RepID=UPI003F6A320E